MRKYQCVNTQVRMTSSNIARQKNVGHARWQNCEFGWQQHSSIGIGIGTSFGFGFGFGFDIIGRHWSTYCNIGDTKHNNKPATTKQKEAETAERKCDFQRCLTCLLHVSRSTSSQTSRKSARSTIRFQVTMVCDCSRHIRSWYVHLIESAATDRL